MDMTKRAIKEAFGFKYDADLAHFLGITRAAVGNWQEDAEIPILRQYELKELRPDLFLNGGAKKRK